MDSGPSVHSSGTVLLGLSGSEVEIISQGTINARLGLGWSPKISEPGVGMLYEKYLTGDMDFSCVSWEW